MTVTNNSATNSVRVIVFPTPAVVASTAIVAQAQRFAKIVDVPPLGSGRNIGTVDNTVDIRVFFGLDRLSTSDQPYVAPILGTPSQLLYWQVVTQSLDGVTAVSVSYAVEVFFKTRVFGPVENLF
jgi:hypothetical protein